MAKPTAAATTTTATAIATPLPDIFLRFYHVFSPEFGFATERLRPLVQYMKQKDVDFVEKLVDNLNPLFNRNNVELITILRPQ